MGPWNIFRKNCRAMKYLGLWSPMLRKNFGKCVKPSSPTSYILNVRSLISMLNKIFGRNLTVFDVFTDTTAKFIKFFLLSWVITIEIHFSLMSRLLLLLVLFACLCVCLLVCLLCYYWFWVICLCFYVFEFIHVPMGWHFVL